jgi:hypothetical protein
VLSFFLPESNIPKIGSLILVNALMSVIIFAKISSFFCKNLPEATGAARAKIKAKTRGGPAAIPLRSQSESTTPSLAHATPNEAILVLETILKYMPSRSLRKEKFL